MNGRNKKNKYKSYADRLDYVLQHPLSNPYKITLTRPICDKDFGRYMDHCEARYIDTAFYYINKTYEKLYNKYIVKEIKSENLEDANNDIAEIRWIMAHATPWERGSDAISNTFMRSIYTAMGVKTYPLKKGISLDLEAYCTNLEEYKKKFALYFSKKPQVVD